VIYLEVTKHVESDQSTHFTYYFIQVELKF